MLRQVKLLAGAGKIFRRYCLPAVSADHLRKFTCGPSRKSSLLLSETLL